MLVKFLTSKLEILQLSVRTFISINSLIDYEDCPYPEYEMPEQPIMDPDVHVPEEVKCCQTMCNDSSSDR